MCDPVMLCAAGAHGCLGPAEQRVCTSLNTKAAHTCCSNRPYLRAAADVHSCAVGSLKVPHAVLSGADTDLHLRVLLQRGRRTRFGHSFCERRACDHPSSAGRAHLGRGELGAQRCDLPLSGRARLLLLLQLHRREGMRCALVGEVLHHLRPRPPHLLQLRRRGLELLRAPGKCSEGLAAPCHEH